MALMMMLCMPSRLGLRMTKRVYSDAGENFHHVHKRNGYSLSRLDVGPPCCETDKHCRTRSNQCFTQDKVGQTGLCGSVLAVPRTWVRRAKRAELLYRESIRLRCRTGSIALKRKKLDYSVRRSRRAVRSISGLRPRRPVRRGRKITLHSTNYLQSPIENVFHSFLQPRYRSPFCV